MTPMKALVEDDGRKIVDGIASRVGILKGGVYDILR